MKQIIYGAHKECLCQHQIVNFVDLINEGSCCTTTHLSTFAISESLEQNVIINTGTIINYSYNCLENPG